MKTVTLISQDKRFPVEIDVICVSTYINNLIRNLAADEEEESDDEDASSPREVYEIPIQEVSAPILSKVLDWCHHYHDLHKDDIRADTNFGETTSRRNDGTFYKYDADEGDNDDDDDDDDEDEDLRSVPLDPWEREFLNTDSKTIQEIIMAANYLNIKPLLQISCKFVAELVRGRTPNEIVQVFKILEESKS